MSSAVTAALTAAFGADRVKVHAPLAPLTTFKVGGPADWLVETHGADELSAALAIGRRAGVAVTILGGGSNVLVSDHGIRGLVIRTRGGTIVAEGPSGVRADVGVTLNSLVRWTISRGHRGLEAWAGTPGTVGGAVFGNAHFGGRSIGELVASVRLVTADGHTVDAPGAGLEFAYDCSRLQRTGEVALSVLFALAPGADHAAMRETARRSLALRKRTQPLDTPSAGCIFRNPDPASEPIPAGIPASAGALVDRAGLKGHAIGGARVSPVHANFIVNDGKATAADVRALIRLCQERVLDRFGVRLREEIRYLGEFDA